MCVLHSVERHCFCTAQSRKAFLCVLHSLESASLEGQDKTITVILAKHSINLPDVGSLVIRSLVGTILNIFKYFIRIIICPRIIYLCMCSIIKCFNRY